MHNSFNELSIIDYLFLKWTFDNIRFILVLSIFWIMKIFITNRKFEKLKQC